VIDLGAGRWALGTLAWPMSWMVASLESRPGTLHRYPGAGVPAWRPRPDGDLESASHGAEMPARPGGSPGEGVPGCRMAAQQRSVGALDGGPARCRPGGGSPGLAEAQPGEVVPAPPNRGCPGPALAGAAMCRPSLSLCRLLLHKSGLGLIIPAQEWLFWPE
jgi:hypothetical protein